MTVDLARARPRYVILELTTRCNLRCLYCAVSQPGFHGQDLELGHVELVERLVRLAPEEVQISGHGESSLARDWHRLAAELLAVGIKVSITTNAALVWSAEELDVLARFRCITVSCDTCDPTLFARLRRGARLERLEQNLRNLREHVRRRGSSGPHVAINCTLSDLVVPGLSDLVVWASELGLRGVSLTNLVEYPALDPAAPVRHPIDVDPRGARAAIEQARHTARKVGIEFIVMEGLAERLAAAGP